MIARSEANEMSDNPGTNGKIIRSLKVSNKMRSNHSSPLDDEKSFARYLNRSAQC